MPPIDDNYTVCYGAETSTIDSEYLKSHDKVKKWFNNYLDKSTVDEESGSIFSQSITDEKMLDYIVQGHSTKEHNINPVSVHDTGYCTSTDNSNTTATTTIDTGYYSDSTNESTIQQNISKKAKFCDTTKEATYISPQEEPNFFVTVEDKHLETATDTENNCNKQGEYILDSTTSSQHTPPPIELSTKEPNKSLTVFDSEVDDFPYTTAEINLTSNSLGNPTLTGDKCGNINSPTIAEGQYFPYTTAVSQDEC